MRIATPFARVEQVDLREVLTEAGNTIVVGGVAAEQLEHRFTGRDDY